MTDTNNCSRLIPFGQKSGQGQGNAKCEKNQFDYILFASWHVSLCMCKNYTSSGLFNILDYT